MDYSHDFFISYTGADRQWAEWIAWTLEDKGYRCQIQAWDFGPTSNFVLKMQQAAVQCERTIAVLTDAYLRSDFTAPEWAAAYAADPTGNTGKLVVVRVEPCSPPGLLNTIVYVDLAGVEETAAEERLLSALAQLRAGRGKPSTRPSFPTSAAPTVLLSSVPDKPSFPGALPPFWNIPHPRNPFFTGREDYLLRLHSALADPDTAVSIRAIAGLGGVGKTQTALEYAYRYKHKYTAVLWSQADNETTLNAGFRSIAGILDLSEKEAQDAGEVREAVRRWLSTHHDYLLILDNVNSPRDLKEFLPTHPAGHILLTSRTHNFAMLHLPTALELDTLSPEEALAFLFRRTGREAANPTEQEAAVELARELGYLPLALEQAAAYIAVQQTLFTNYLRSYRKRRLELLEKHPPEAGGFRDTIATTWAMNLEQVEKESAASAELLRVSAFLAPDRIPHEIFIEGGSHLGPLLAPVLEEASEDPLLLDELLEPLARYSLIRRDIQEGAYNIHRLVQLVIQAGMDEKIQQEYAGQVVSALADTYPEIDVSQWPLCERLLPHSLTCYDHIRRYNLESRDVALILNRAALYLDAQAQYSAAEPLYHLALAIAEKVLGSDHPDTASIMNNLAGLYDSQGNYTTAESLLRRALVIAEKVLGPDHPDTASSLNSLAFVLDSQGNYAAAEPLYQRALKIKEKVLGPSHPDTALSLNNLALLYYYQGNYNAAEPLFRRALGTWETVLGPDHPQTATCLNNLAELYNSQGNSAAAEPLYQRAHVILEKVLGPDHPTTITVRNNYNGLRGQIGDPQP